VKFVLAPRSLTLRLGLLMALVATAVFATTVYLLQRNLDHILHLDEEADLAVKQQVVQRFLAEVRTGADLPRLRRHLDAAGIGGRYRWNVWLVAPDGRPLYGDAVPPNVEIAPQRIRIERQDGVALRGTTYLVDDHPVLQGSRVYIGMDPRPRLVMMRRFDRASTIVCIAGILVTSVLALLVARRSLRPVQALSDQAAGINPDVLSRRLALPESASELLPLARRFNEVLDRIETAWTQLDGFNADVAHELRTPLAVMINGAEIALARERPAAELREVLETQLEELRELAGMVSDMLFLARADRGALADKLAAVSLGREALRVVDFVEALAADKGQQVAVEGDATVVANAALVCRAIVNLLTNALRHADPGTRIAVRLAAGADGAVVEVVNPGPPIPEEVRQRMFDRFWRGDSARAREGDRFGLGLAIVRAVAGMHGGRVFVQCENGYNRIGFTLPADARTVA